MGNKVFSSRYLSPRSNAGDLAAAAVAMDRWTGLLQAPLSLGGPPFRVAASFILSCQKPSPFQAPTRSSSRATASAAPAIERLSDAGLLAGKLDGEANAWLIDAACFAGPFVVYRELVPSVDTVGDPKRYDPTGFPAAAGVANILTHCVGEVSVETIMVNDEEDRD